MVETLIESEMNIHLKNSGCTPIQWAILECNLLFICRFVAQTTLDLRKIFAGKIHFILSFQFAKISLKC